MLEQTRYFLPGPSREQVNYEVNDPVGSAPVVDFGYVFMVIRRRFKLILSMMLLAAGVGLLVYYSATPLYESKARLIVEKRSIDTLQRDSVLNFPSLNTSEADSQLEVIKSDSLVREAVVNLDLMSYPIVPSPMKKLQSELSVMADEHLESFEFVSRFLEQEEFLPMVQNLVDLVQKRMTVRRVALSHVYTIEVTWEDPVLSANIANGIAQAYINDRLRRREAETKEAIAWLETRLEELRIQAEEAKDNVAQFRLNNNIVEAGREGLLVGQQLASLSRQILDAEAEAQKALEETTRFRVVNLENINTAPLPSTSETENLVELRDELARLEEEWLAAETQFGSNGRLAREKEAEINSVRKRMAAEIERVRAVLSSNYGFAASRLENQRQKLNQLTELATTVGSAQVNLEALQSEAEVYQNIYDSYLQRYMQTVQQQTLPTSDARIISPAVPAEYDTVSGSKIMMMATSIGLCFGLAAALVRERMDRSVRTLQQLRMASGTIVFGVLPRLPRAYSKGADALRNGNRLPTEGRYIANDARYRIVVDEPRSRFSETIRRIKVDMDNVRSLSTNVTVGFISAGSNNTRGIVAGNYAHLLAATGISTLLIDLDFHHSLLSRALAPGAADQAFDPYSSVDMKKVEAAIWNDPHSILNFLPASNVDDPNSDALAFVNIDQIGHILMQLANKYQRIVIDMPPLQESSDAAALADLVSGYVLVSEWGRTTIDSVARQVSESGIPAGKVTGAVLGDVDLEKYKKYERLG